MTTLNKRALALELKHIRNEVTIFSSHHTITQRQLKTVEQQLALAHEDPTSIPVFIVSFERVADLSKLVSWLEKHKLTRITFIDNDSTYPSLLDFYQNSPYQLLRLYRNVGHTAPWSLGIIRALVQEEFYIVTDPDILPSEECPTDFMEHFLQLHEQFLAYQKVGFGLKIDDLPDTFRLRQEVISWESQFWKHKLAPGAYEAGIDTTFALYKPFTYRYMLHPSIRTDKPYTARHLPWYHDPAKETAEDVYYRFRADRNVNSWNSGNLPERYRKEMRKHKRN